MMTAEQHIKQAVTTTDLLQAELVRSVHMEEYDRNMLIGAVILGDAVLFNSEPGLGKTTIANATASMIGGSFRRVQGTQDLLPSDITGHEVYNPSTGEFSLRPGPLMANVVLFDEISRTAPRSQSALLEAMQEKQMTIGNTTLELPKPFNVFATQNPDEIGEGTNPLTKANLDRFAIGISLKALTAQDRISIRALTLRGYVPEQVTDANAILHAKAVVETIPDTNEMYDRANRIIDYTRGIGKIELTQSVLGGERPFSHILDIAKTQALLDGRVMVRDRDIDLAAKFVLPHRIQVTHDAEDNGISASDVVAAAIHHA